MQLEFGPTYVLTKGLICSKLNAAGDIEDGTDPSLPEGTRFVALDRYDRWPYSTKLKDWLPDSEYYSIKLEDPFDGRDMYEALAHRLEQDSRLAD